MVNVYDTANQLERELREIPEFTSLKTAFEAVKEDEVAFELFVEFQQMQLMLQQKQMTGMPFTEEEEAAAQAMSVRVQENEKIRTLMEKEQALSTLLTDLNQIIMRPVQELYAQD